MQKILIGSFVLAALAAAVAAATRCLVGLAIIFVPIAAVYALLKLSPAYRGATDVTLAKTFCD